MNEDIPYFSARQIAPALGCSKKSVQRYAETAAWPMRQIGNRFEFQPPQEIALRIIMPEREVATKERKVKFTDLTHSDEARTLVLARERAVLHFRDAIRKGLPVEFALSATVTHFTQELGTFSTRTLRNWDAAYRTHGLNGLVEQKRGIVGRKGVEIPESVANKGKALFIEHGSAAQANQHLAADPTLSADLRLICHGGYASKSYVNPSLRKAITPAPSTAALAQGSRHARLSGRFTPCHYQDVRAGEIFCSDDMTNNGLCWVEWPNAQGWRLGQPQILPVIDVGSLRWLNVRVIMRESGQYTADDIWGLFGDVFDTFGLPALGFVLEGGHWQSNAVKGHRTGIGDDQRIGGLESLGLKMFRSYDPRTKIIETMFNQLQYAGDAFLGYTGRDQRKQLPEAVKRQKQLCDAGKAHPSEFFPHITKLADHIQTVMGNMNYARNDGKILRGSCALDKWAEDAPQLSMLPDSAKWMYRSAMSVCLVTKNGIRVTQNSGKKLIAYYYDNPELLTPRKGCRVIVYWNDRHPEADAAVLDAATHNFICIAKFVPELGRFSATPDQLAAERARKAAEIHFARTELRAIQPDMQRKHLPARMDVPTQQMGQSLREAVERQVTEEKQLRDSRREVRNAELAETDLAAVLGEDTEETNPRSDLDILLGSQH